MRSNRLPANKALSIILSIGLTTGPARACVRGEHGKAPVGGRAIRGSTASFLYYIVYIQTVFVSLSFLCVNIPDALPNIPAETKRVIVRRTRPEAEITKALLHTLSIHAMRFTATTPLSFRGVSRRRRIIFCTHWHTSRGLRSARTGSGGPGTLT